MPHPTKHALLVMYDKVELRIPFNPVFVNEVKSSTEDSQFGWVDPTRYDFRLSGEFKMVGSRMEVTDIRNSTWDNISSGISGVAVGFFAQGQGLYKWPCVVVKASPAKILQGHNVFGSECPRAGVMQMLAMLSQAFPKLYSHLSIDNAEVRAVDCTYSARVSDFFTNKIFNLFEHLATGRQKVNADYKDRGWLLIGKNSEYQRAKLYRKLQEVLDDLASAKKLKHHHRVAVLSDPRLQEFARDLLRFEATICARKLIDTLSIPTKLVEFLKFNDWFLSVHKVPLSRYLWEVTFKPIFAQIEGHTMKNVDDSHIKLKIDAQFIRIKDNGKLCKRKANAVWATYCDIKREGYDHLCKLNNKTFFRNVKHLEEIGLAKGFLKSLDPNHPADNVVPFIQLIKIDFTTQRPDWYEEPVAGFSEPQRQLRLVS